MQVVERTSIEAASTGAEPPPAPSRWSAEREAAFTAWTRRTPDAEGRSSRILPRRRPTRRGPWLARLLREPR
jgi:hypothetical protein